MSTPDDGRRPVEQPGLSYLPRFIEEEEAQELIDYFAQIVPIWEQRHRDEEHARSAGHTRRLTRPVYWLGAWQFASLGYYAEPHYREDRCLRAEVLSPVMQRILQRLQRLHGEVVPEPDALLPNTCLINFYGREVKNGVSRDYARLRMHQDHEPGPVIIFTIGQAGLLEFVDPDRSPDPELGLWLRHRSVAIVSGPELKGRLYHRISQVRTGEQPALSCRIDNFQVRRISVSFRHVPEELIKDFGEFPEPRRERVRDYVEELAEHSGHFRAQLQGSEPA